jgi:hypothetical protein
MLKVTQTSENDILVSGGSVSLPSSRSPLTSDVGAQLVSFAARHDGKHSPHSKKKVVKNWNPSIQVGEGVSGGRYRVASQSQRYIAAPGARRLWTQPRPKR